LPNLIAVSPATTTGLLAAGNFAGGPNRFLTQNDPRFDMEVAAVWQLENGGLGTVGRIRQRKAEQDVAAFELTRTVFRVRSEVAQALARLQTARVRVVETEEGVIQAVESADKNFIGLRETTRPAGELLRLIVRPQEVVAAIIALNVAYQQYAAAVNEYNAAQFELYRALGRPAQWVTCQAAPPPAPANPAPATAAPRPDRARR
jgi:outer membrane protein TolC